MPENLKELYRDYLGRFNTMALATANGSGRTSCAVVCYAYDERGAICFAAANPTLKVKHLRENPSVAVAMDDGGKSMVGIQIRGAVEPIEKPEAVDRARKLLCARNPSVAQFYDKPEVSYWWIRANECYLINFGWGVEWRQKVPA